MARGRPTKFKKDLIKDAELLTGLGFTETDFATYWNISTRTFERWKQKNEDFCRAIKKGQLNANITVTKQLYNKATNEGEMTAIIFWLINRCPENWKDRRALVNQVISGGRDINVTTQTKNAEIRQMVSSWTPEEKKRFVAVVTSLNKEFKTKRIGEIIKVEDEQGENEEVKADQEANQGMEEVSEGEGGASGNEEN